MLAHHDDLSTDKDDLREFEKYLAFFFQTVSPRGAESYTYLKALAETAKQTIDAIAPAQSKRLYIVCDLAIGLIIALVSVIHDTFWGGGGEGKGYKLLMLGCVALQAARPGWKLKPYPGDVVLPGSLFRRPPKVRVLWRPIDTNAHPSSPS